MGIIEFIDKVCVQTMVYWEAGSNDGYGKPTFSIGVEAYCRWDGKTETITNKYGKQVVSKAQVMTNEDLSDNGYLYLGVLDDLTAEQIADPRKVAEAYMIQAIVKNPLFKSTDKFVKTIYL